MSIKSAHLAKPLLAALVLISLTGCSISTSKDSETGKDKNVDIRTPFGSLSVHKGASDPKETGLTAYPGAQIKSDLDDHDGSANVNISSSVFGLKVVALKYQTSDPPDKVLAFYRKDMSRFGKVVDCTGGFSMGLHRHDHNGDAEVTCDNHDGGDHQYKEELKVGTENNQRIIAVKPNSTGSEFAMVYVRAWEEKNTM
jgi:hypothetical protein